MKTLATFCQEHSDVAIDLTLNDSATIARRVVECEVDVAIVGHLGLDSRYLSMPFSRQDLVVLVPTSHPWADRGGISLLELGTARLIMRKGGSMSRRVLETAFVSAGIEPQVALELDREGALEAVRAGLGVAVATTAEILPDVNFRVLGITDIDLHTDAFVICLEARRGSPMVAAFLRTAARCRHETVSGIARRRPMPLVALASSN